VWLDNGFPWPPPGRPRACWEFFTTLQPGMPGAHAHGLPKKAAEELNPDSAAKQDILALRKMIRASECKNVRLNESMVRRPGAQENMT
jgi:hypothetical protein